MTNNYHQTPEDSDKCPKSVFNTKGLLKQFSRLELNTPNSEDDLDYLEGPSDLDLFPLGESEEDYKAKRDITELTDIDELNPDELLRENGFYDSSDKRCCINKKRR